MTYQLSQNLISKKRIFSTFLLSFLMITIYAQPAKKDYSEAFTLIEVWLEAQKDFEQFPGITAIAVEDQDVLWTGGFGLSNIDKNTKMDPGTICSICSISKLFTAVAIMKLYDEGKLRLDDEVSDLLPWYNLPQKYPDSGPITIRSLLTHSSGLPRESDFAYWNGPDYPFPSRAQVKAKLAEQETLYPASTYYQYSNLALTLLGEIVQEISGVPYDDFIQQYILTPLGLNNTKTSLPEDLYGSKLAIGYGSVNRNGKRDKINLFQAKGIKPAAGFSSNVSDLAKFASWQLRLLDTTASEILRPSTLKNMQRVHFTDPDWNTTWGLGFAVYKGSDGSKWVSHGGSCPGYRSSFMLNPKSKRAYVVMINANGTNPSKYAHAMHQILNKAETDLNSKEENKKSLQDFVGYYSQQPWWSEVYVGSWNDKLVMLDLPTDNPADAMTFFKYIEGDTFRRIRDDDELGESVTFERDKSGKIINYKVHGYYAQKMK